MIDPFRFGPWVSDAARARFRRESESGPPSADIVDLRRYYDGYNEEHLAEALAIDPVRISERQIGGVLTHVVEPVDSATDSRKLICLHGGAFMWGSGPGALLEAVPVAAATGMQVLAVDYRLAPEHGFPAAIDDVLSVYREIVAVQNAREIGIYGCSAGAVLTASGILQVIGLIG